MSNEVSPAAQLVGDLAPKLVELTDEVLFGEVWARPGLSPRDRSLITVSALVAGYRTGQMKSHLRLELSNGLTVDELVEAITHLAFYTGWPNAITGMTHLKEVLAEQLEPKELHLVQGTCHIDLYCKPEHVPEAVAKLGDFFNTHLSGQRSVAR